jgi:hypothetical protein
MYAEDTANRRTNAVLRYAYQANAESFLKGSAKARQ